MYVAEPKVSEATRLCSRLPPTANEPRSPDKPYSPFVNNLSTVV
jgi:hypothetical protein